MQNYGNRVNDKDILLKTPVFRYGTGEYNGSVMQAMVNSEMYW